MDRYIICNFLLSPILPPALRQQAQRVTRSNEAPAPSPLLAAASSISKIVSSAPSSSAPASSAAAGVVVQGWDSARGATDGQILLPGQCHAAPPSRIRHAAASVCFRLAPPLPHGMTRQVVIKKLAVPPPLPPTPPATSLLIQLFISIILGLARGD